MEQDKTEAKYHLYVTEYDKSIEYMILDRKIEDHDGNEFSLYLEPIIQIKYSKVCRNSTVDFRPTTIDIDFRFNISRYIVDDPAKFKELTYNINNSLTRYHLDCLLHVSQCLIDDLDVCRRVSNLIRGILGR